MAITTVTMKRHDTLPILLSTLTDSEGNVIDLIGASVSFTMKNLSNGNVKVDTQECIVISEISGMVSYTWKEEDTDVAGEYLGEFEIITDAGKRTIPTLDTLAIVILEDFNNR